MAARDRTFRPEHLVEAQPVGVLVSGLSDRRRRHSVAPTAATTNPPRPTARITAVHPRPATRWASAASGPPPVGRLASAACAGALVAGLPLWAAGVASGTAAAGGC